MERLVDRDATTTVWLLALIHQECQLIKPRQRRAKLTRAADTDLPCSETLSPQHFEPVTEVATTRS